MTVETRRLSTVPVDTALSMLGRCVATSIDEEHDNKSAPVGAPTPDDRGLADREEHDRLMGIMPLPTDPSSTCTEPHADGCPECVVNVETPWLHETRADGCSTAYECHDCGHSWATSWAVR